MNTARVVTDRAREPWAVEEARAPKPGGTILRYRHELGYELLAMAPRRLDALADGELVRLLEEARRRSPTGLPGTAA